MEHGPEDPHPVRLRCLRHLGTCISSPDGSVGPPAHEPPHALTVEGRIVLAGDDGEIHLLSTANLETLEKFPDWSSEGIVYTREGAIVVRNPDGSIELDLSEQTGLFGQFPAWVT